MNLNTIDSEKLKANVFEIIDKYKDDQLYNEIQKLEKPHTVWQAYVETVDSLGQIWRSLGRDTMGISDVDYSLAHALLFKTLPSNIKRIIVVKMEELMNARIYMKSEEALSFFKVLT